MGETDNLDDVKAIFGLVMHGYLKDFQRLKRIIENNTSLKIRYQKVSLKKLFIVEETDDDHLVRGRRRRQPFEEGSLDK